MLAGPGPTEQVVETSNRRWREDEFLISSALSRGKSKLRVRIQHVPSQIPLFPGDPPVASAWSEYRYWVYSFVLPKP